MRVHWTRAALDHLTCIHDYIARDSPVYARLWVNKLTRRSQQIATFPKSERKVPEYQKEDLREVIEKPYRIIYRIKTDQIDIVSVVHGAQKLREIPDQ